MTGYKIVSRRDGKLWSYTGGNDRVGKTRWLEYAEGLTTSRQGNNGPLGVFKSIGTALQFTGYVAHLFSSLGIFECEYTESEAKGFWYVDEAGKLQNLGDIWVPRGTVYADSVTLIRELTKEEYGL